MEEGNPFELELIGICQSLVSQNFLDQYLLLFWSPSTTSIHVICGWDWLYSKIITLSNKDLCMHSLNSLHNFSSFSQITRFGIWLPYYCFLSKANISHFLLQLGGRLLHILKRLLPISVYLLQVWALYVCGLMAFVPYVYRPHKYHFLIRPKL